MKNEFSKINLDVLQNLGHSHKFQVGMRSHLMITITINVTEKRL